jgi:adenylate cyclase
MTALGTLLRTPVVASVVVGLLVASGTIGLRQTGSLESLELAVYDWYIRLQPKTLASASRLVVIRVTEEDIRQQGTWPLPDATLAQVLTILIQHQPRAIGLDIYRDVPVPPGREQLDAVLTSHSHIIVPMKFGENGTNGVPPPPVLQDTEQVGFADVLVDPGGIVRRGLLFLGGGETPAYAFALRLALLYLLPEDVFPQPDPVNPQFLRLGPTTIRRFEANDGSYIRADAQGYQFLLDFRDVPSAFPSYSLANLLAGEIKPEEIKDKIVLFGVMAESVKDAFYTPYSRGHHADQQMAGIVLHAHMISQLLRAALSGDAPLDTMSDTWEWGWIVLWSLMGSMVGLWLRSPWRFTCVAIGGLLLLSFATYSAFVRSWWLPVVPPALTWVTAAAVVTAYTSKRETKQRAFLMQLFARHVSPEVADTIWHEREQFLHNGRPRSQRMMVSVLFTDLVGFTSVSEKMEPQALVDWLNEYMEAMTPHVIGYHGVVLKYIGDGIMAVFGVPLARTTEAEIHQDALHAVQCALAMQRDLIQLNRRWRTQQLPMIGMRIGIFTGLVVGGSQGSTQRLEYNVHGDTVNTASRLESFAKESFVPDFLRDPCRILIGETTLQYLDDRFETQWVGEVRLKGKEEEVSVYRVVSDKESHISGMAQKEAE